jgi:hypothetical protein
MPERMTDEQYQATQGQLMVLAQVVQEMDLSGFLGRIEYCHALGPMLHPTEYRDTLYDGRAETLDVIREGAIAASDFKAAVSKAVSRHRQRAGVSDPHAS